MVHANEHYPVPEQGRFVQGETRKITTWELLSGLLGRE